MYRSTISLFFGMLFFASCSVGSPRFTVNIEGLKDDSLICSFVTLDIIRERGRMPRYVVGGERNADSSMTFDIKLPDGDQLYKVFLAPQSFRGDGPNQSMEFFLIPGEKTHVDATYKSKHQTINYTISGSDVQQEWIEYSKVFENLQMHLDLKSFMIMAVSDQSAVRDSLIQQSLILRDSINGIKADYIGANPTEQLSGYCLTTVDDVHIIDSLYQLLDDKVKNGPLKGWLDLQNEMTKELIASEKARADIANEVSAPADSLIK